MDDMQEIANLLIVTEADRQQFPGYVGCDELIKMKKLMKWTQKKTDEIRKSA